MESVSIEEGRRILGELVDRARLAGQPTLITRHGKPAAMIVPVPADGPEALQQEADRS